MEKHNFEQIGDRLINDQNFISKLSKALKGESAVLTGDKVGLDDLIEQLRQILHELIRHQLENELRQIIEDNNRILMEIKESMTTQSIEKPIHEIQEVSFSEVHRLMDEQRKKVTIPEQINDASLDKSISAFVELKVETIQERVIGLDKRLKSMEEKYETNLKSVWNVLSITQSAIFDHLKQAKAKAKSCLEKSSMIEQKPQAQKKSFFGDFFKSSK